MRFWLSGEIMVDVSERYRDARNEVEDYFNTAMASGQYGPALRTLALVAILRPDDHPDYPEVQKYQKKEAKAEFRLKIDYQSFRAADPLRARRLICESLARAIQLLPGMVKDVDYSRLLADFSSAARAKNWM